MVFAKGKLMFAAGDKITAEEEGRNLTFVAVRGRRCERCEFCPVCDRNNKENMIARFCGETHFVLSETK